MIRCSTICVFKTSFCSLFVYGKRKKGEKKGRVEAWSKGVGAQEEEKEVGEKKNLLGCFGVQDSSCYWLTTLFSDLSNNEHIVYIQISIG